MEYSFLLTCIYIYKLTYINLGTYRYKFIVRYGCQTYSLYIYAVIQPACTEAYTYI